MKMRRISQDSSVSSREEELSDVMGKIEDASSQVDKALSSFHPNSISAKNHKRRVLHKSQSDVFQKHKFRKI